MDESMQARRRPQPLLLVSILVVSAALAWSTVAVVAASSSVQLGVRTSATLGKYLTGPNGHALYTLSSEPQNGVLCTGGCLDAWPPLTVTSGGTVKAPAGVSGTFGTFTRSDNGMTQATENGHALYYFKNDTDAEDTYGEGLKAFGGVWHVAKAVVASAQVPTTSTEPVGSENTPVLPSAILVLIAVATLGLVLIRPLPRRARQR